MCPFLHTARCTNVCTFEPLALHSELVRDSERRLKLYRSQISKNLKKQEIEVSNLFVKIMMNKTELQQLKKLQHQSTEKSISNYVRKLSLQKSVIIKFRNSSADDFLSDMLN